MMLTMLQRAHRNLAVTSMSQTRFFGAAIPHSRMPTEKDYYKILGVDKTATPEMIKDAYRELAKQHHPDIVGSAAPDADKFRDLMEAYGVLSVPESRASYDITMKKNPDAYREITENEYIKSYFPSRRDEAGNTPTDRPAAGSYAETRLAELKEQRKKYNVNDLGYYRGGVPQKGKGTIRGSAMGRPGEFHTPQVHNFYNNYHADAKLVSSEDALKFKNFMAADKVDYNMTRPSRPMYYDRDFNFMKERSFWLRLFLLTLFGMYGIQKIWVERDRMMRWDRIENLENMAEHHFFNRGGVLTKKQFMGFEKIHKSESDMALWYRKSSPTLFPAKE